MYANTHAHAQTRGQNYTHSCCQFHAIPLIDCDGNVKKRSNVPTYAKGSLKGSKHRCKFEFSEKMNSTHLVKPQGFTQRVLVRNNEFNFVSSQKYSTWCL